MPPADWRICALITYGTEALWLIPTKASDTLPFQERYEQPET
ncbi:MAG: hypothetical protein H6Q86_1269 [candidate division NC10 bacterium]|jgi:hypothetical protein|nr:hypothetical protein [candidate division NC10 bacterium]